jgi:transposase
MIHLPASVRVYLCLTACDIRKSFDSLHALVRDHLELDAYAGHLVVFASRRRDRIKILYWARDGFALWSKRLEEGTYAMPSAESAAERRREITAPELPSGASDISVPFKRTDLCHFVLGIE